jgi:phage terminase large subunit-like protein
MTAWKSEKGTTRVKTYYWFDGDPAEELYFMTWGI